VPIQKFAVGNRTLSLDELADLKVGEVGVAAEIAVVTDTKRIHTATSEAIISAEPTALLTKPGVEITGSPGTLEKAKEVLPARFKQRKSKRILSTPNGEKIVDVQTITVTGLDGTELRGLVDRLKLLDLPFADVTVRGIKGVGIPKRISVVETDKGYVMAPDPRGFRVEKFHNYSAGRRALSKAEREAVGRVMDFPEHFEPQYKRGRTIGFVSRYNLGRTIWKEMP
jgi:hypothetical protein